MNELWVITNIQNNHLPCVNVMYIALIVNICVLWWFHIKISKCALNTVRSASLYISTALKAWREPIAGRRPRGLVWLSGCVFSEAASLPFSGVNPGFSPFAARARSALSSAEPLPAPGRSLWEGRRLVPGHGRLHLLQAQQRERPAYQGTGASSAPSPLLPSPPGGGACGSSAPSEEVGLVGGGPSVFKIAHPPLSQFCWGSFLRNLLMI